MKKISIVYIALLSFLFLPCFPATSQTAVDISTPVGISQVDGNGVDIIQGTYNFQLPALSIGPSGPGGLTFSHANPTQPEWDSYSGDISGSTDITDPEWDGVTWKSTSFATVTLPGLTDYFSGSGVSAFGTGATLVGYTYTTSDGTQYMFSPTIASVPKTNMGLLTSIYYPNKEIITINYLCRTNKFAVGQGSPFLLCRKQSVSTTTGYQLIYAYTSDAVPETYQPSDYVPWSTLSSATLINSALVYYDPSANGSDFFGTQPNGLPWPTVSYSRANFNANTRAFTSLTATYGSAADGTQGAWVLGSDNSTSNRVTSVQRPGSSSPAISLTWSNSSYSGVSVVQTISYGGNSWTYNFATSGTTPVTDLNNYRRTYVYNLAQYQISSLTNELGRTTSYAYVAAGSNGAGKLQQVTYPENNKVAYTYNANGDVIQTDQIPKDGSAHIVTHSAYPSDTACASPLTCHKPLTTTDAAGNVTSYTYDATTGNVTTATLPAGANGIRAQTRYTYAQHYPGVMNSIQSPGTLAPIPSSEGIWRLSTTSTCLTTASCTGTADESRTTITYPADGAANNLLPISSTAAAGDGSVGASASMTYDSLGNPLTSTDPNNNTTRYRYDSLRRLVGGILPADANGIYRATRTTYNPDGTTQKSELGTVPSQADANWSSFTSLQQQIAVYDGLGRAVQSSAGSNNTQTLTQTSYDIEGNTQCVALRMDTTTYASLSGTSACSQSSSGGDRITQYAYYADHSPQSATTLASTANGVSYAAVPQASYTYNPNGTRHSIADGKGNTTTYTYDGFDRLAGTQWPITHTGANPAGTLVQSFGYDNLGHVTSASANGQTLSYAYNALGELLSETQPLGKVSYTYDAAGNRARLIWPDGFAAAYTYDATNQLLAITAIQPSSAAFVVANFAYDSLGRRHTLTHGNGANTAYGYNGIFPSSLTFTFAGTPADNQTYGFTYNPAGQITGETFSNQAYDVTSALSASGSLTYSNNALNQTTVIGTNPISYDGQGNFRSNGTVTYTYDPLNHLLSNSVGGTLTYDPISRLASAAGAGGATSKFLYDGSHAIAEYSGSTPTQHYIFGPGADEPLVWYTGGTTTAPQYLLADQRGSIVATADASGSLIGAVNTYTEYGLSGTNDTGRFQYTGQMYLPEIGIYHYKARDYLPAWGRFVQADPSGYSAGMNLYAYAGGDPINNVDPSGLSLCATRDIDMTHTETSPDGTSITSTGSTASDQICLDIGPLSGNYSGGVESPPPPPPPTKCLIGSTSLTKSGNNINITGNISFPNGQEKYLSIINNAWTGNFGPYNVTTNMTIGNGGLTALIANGPNGRPTANIGGPNMNLNTLIGATPSQLNYSQWSAGHEFGHAGLGLEDQYTDANGPNSGYENDIMGAVNGRPSAADMATALLGCH